MHRCLKHIYSYNRS